MEHMNAIKAVQITLFRGIAIPAKKDNLAKPFMVVSPNGFILDVFGPFSARPNDASIMKKLLDDERFCSFFVEKDIFVLDRGFRDCVQNLRQKSFEVFTPAFSYGRQTLTTAQANHSRLVTKVRYVVEVVNGHLKTKYSFLSNCLRNNLLDQAHRIYRIVASINNKFGSRIYSDQGREAEVIQTFLDNLSRDNLLKAIVEELGLVRRRSYFSPLESFDQIPCLSLGQLRRIAGGSYQVTESVNYYFDTLHRFGRLSHFCCSLSIDLERFNIHAQDPILIRTKIGSRYSRAGFYLVFVLIDKASESHQCIREYYCQCLVGSRTLGCCCHVMAVIWHLTWARDTDRIRGPAEWLNNFAIECESAD